MAKVKTKLLFLLGFILVIILAYLIWSTRHLLLSFGEKKLGDHCLVLKNKSNRDIQFYFSQTIDNRFFFDLAKPFRLRNEVKNNTVIRVDTIVEPLSYISPLKEEKIHCVDDWDDLVQKSNYIRLYIYDVDSVLKLDWKHPDETAIDKVILKVISYNIDSLKLHNGVIEYVN